jgi:hypothetical protein
MRRASPVLALLSLLLLGCPRTGPTGTDPGLAVDQLVRRDLGFPPSRRALEALEELRRLGGTGPVACPAASARASFLLDLFDFVRLSPREDERPARGHAELWSALGLAGAPSRGPLATAQVLQGIERALREARVACGGRAPLIAEAEELLAVDRRPRRSLAEMIAVARDYARLGLVSTNSELRLHDWCSKAIRLAAGGDPAPQRARINQCLLTLWGTDPHPYFEASPAARPTDPPWTTVATRLAEKRRALAERAGRLRGLVLALLADDARFLELAAPVLPTPLDLARTALPRSSAGEPWDRTPLVLLTDRGALVGGRAVLADAEASVLAGAIAARLHNDRRGRVCLAAPSGTSADRVLEVARAARRAGATILELGVVRTIALRAPDGDIQATIFGRARPVQRLETIPVSLALYSTPNPGGSGRDRPLGLTFDRAAAPNELALILGRAGITAVSRDGALPVRPRAELADLLATLRRTCPDDTSLVLGVESSLTLDTLIQAIEIARRPASGYLGVAIAASGMVPRGDGDLAAVIRTLGALRIQTIPAQPEAVTAALRGCYLEELRARTSAETPLAGELVLQLGARGLRATGGGLGRHQRLRACLEAALAKREPATATRLTIRFDLAAPR